MLITDWALPELLRLVGEALAGAQGEPVAVQHRHPGVIDRQFLEEARALASLCSQFAGARLFINRRLDVAKLVDAHLHLPATGLTVRDARQSLGDGKLISCAVHDASEVQPEADFTLVSPVYSPGSKPDDTRAPLLVDGFHSLAALVPTAFALGGMTAERVKMLKPAGVAVISEILKAPSPRLAMRELCGAFST